MSAVTKEGIIAELETALQAHENALCLIDGALIGKGHIVRIGELGVAFTVLPDGTVKDPRPVPPYSATCFTQKEAERIALNARNAAGERGVAVHVSDAIRERLTSLNALLASISNI